jgi:selT/selW/selH-like putative selenoprotein
VVAEILKAKTNEVEAATLIPGSDGVFTLTVNGRVIFSKADTGRFPNPGEVVALLP